jgi:hypothetical protein
MAPLFNRALPLLLNCTPDLLVGVSFPLHGTSPKGCIVPEKLALPPDQF